METVITQFLSTENRQQDVGVLEVEGRLGRRVTADTDTATSHFVSGVSTRDFALIDAAFRDDPTFIATVSRTTDVSVQCDGREIRLTDRGGPATRTALIKTRKCSTIVAHASYDVRLSICTETTVPIPSRRSSRVLYKRQKQRTSYAHDGWRVELTTVVGPPNTFEVEVEAPPHLHVHTMAPELTRLINKIFSAIDDV